LALVVGQRIAVAQSPDRLHYKPCSSGLLIPTQTNIANNDLSIKEKGSLQSYVKPDKVLNLLAEESL
jgi:hypothetical protein